MFNPSSKSTPPISVPYETAAVYSEAPLRKRFYVRTRPTESKPFVASKAPQHSNNMAFSQRFLNIPLEHEAPFDPNNTRFNNVPDRYDTLIALGVDEKKVTVIPETRVPNASVFLFKKEDHTLANLLRDQLLQDSRVQFAAYKVPHPLFAEFELRVQTDGTISPREALVNACRGVVRQLEMLGREFTKEWELKRISRMADGDGL